MQGAGAGRAVACHQCQPAWAPLSFLPQLPTHPRLLASPMLVPAPACPSLPGGTRFIGVYLARQLIDAGHEVTLLTRGKKPVTYRIPDDTGRRGGAHSVCGDCMLPRELAAGQACWGTQWLMVQLMDSWWAPAARHGGCCCWSMWGCCCWSFSSTAGQHANMAQRLCRLLRVEGIRAQELCLPTLSGF